MPGYSLAPRAPFARVPFRVVPRGLNRRCLLGRSSVSKLVIAAVLSGQLWGAAGLALGAEAVGEVERVKATSYGTPPGSARVAKQLNDPLVFKELLETLSFSALEASLLDGSVLTLGASAKVVLDEFVYDPSAPGAGAVLDMVEGSLRFVSGTLPKEAFRVSTPLCTIGIRGTNFKVRVRPNGDTLVAVDDGSVLVTVTSTGEDIVVDEGQSVEIRRTGTAAAPVDSVVFTDNDVLLVGNQIVDFGWPQTATYEAGPDQTGEQGETLIFNPTKARRGNSDRNDSKGSSHGGEGGDGGGDGY